MGFLSIEPGPIFRQTYSRHTSASPDKRGVWTHSGLDACCPKCRKQPLPSYTVRQSDNQEGKMIRLPLPFPDTGDSLYRRFQGRGMNPSRRTRIRRCRKRIPCTTTGKKHFSRTVQRSNNGRHSSTPQTRRHIKSRIKGGRKELRLPSITYTYHEKDDSLS